MRKVYVTGAWDLLHLGHVILLGKAKSLGGYLIVGVMSDEFIERTKGRFPIIPWQQRIEMVRALWCVDDAGIVDDHTDYGLIDLFNPSIRVVGPEYGQYEGHIRALEEMSRRGIEVIRIERTEGISTTEIIERIRSECGDNCGCGVEGRRVASGTGKVSGIIPTPG